MRTIALLCLLAALAGWLAWHGDVAVMASGAAAAGPAEPRYTLENVTVQRTDSAGIPTVLLTVAKASYFDDRAARLETIEVTGLSGEAAPWHLHSEFGSVPAGQQRMQLKGPVTGSGRFPDGQAARVAAGAVWVDEDHHNFNSNEPVTLKGATREAHAQGFTASFSGKKLKLNNVEMRYALSR